MHPSAERLWKSLPKIIQDSIATSIDRLQGKLPPQVPLPDMSKPIRLMIGPVNYAGQGYLWCRAAESTGVVSAKNFVHSDNNPLSYPADFTLSWRTAEHSRVWQQDMLDKLRDNYTHVLIEASMPLIGGLHSGNLGKQIELMKDAGLQVGFLAHGTEVRLPSTHSENDPYSYFRDKDWVDPEIFEPVIAENLRFIRKSGLPVFVSTAGLLLDLPNASFLGVIVNPEKWATSSIPLTRERIKVVHAPTNPTPKGTPYIAPVAKKLHAEGLIEYIELRGVPHNDMPAVFADADVVLDQFRAGDYGVAACETMASGRIVLAHVSEQVRGEVSRLAGLPLPIVETNVETVESVLRDIVARREHYQRIASTGPAFVKQLHSGGYSRDTLMKTFLDSE